jgi:hypothetical protein
MTRLPSEEFSIVTKAVMTQYADRYQVKKEMMRRACKIQEQKLDITC